MVRVLWRAAGAGAGLAGGFFCAAAWTARAETPLVDVVFLGTGSSVSVPSLTCLLGDNPCKVCQGAAEGDRNQRRNPSLLLKVPGEHGQRGSNVLVDCGKTFRDGAVTFFRKHGVRYIDSVVLTHAHADAIMGLDDIRDVQECLQRGDPATGTPHKMKTTHVYTDPFCQSVLRGMLPYLFPQPVKDGEAPRFTSTINWHTFDSPAPLSIHGLKVVPLKVEHGKGYVTYGFQFETPKYRFVYLSDLSSIPEATDALLSDGRRIDILVIDSLFKTRPHPTHFNFPTALETVKRYRPVKTYLTGMSHDFDYYTFNTELRALRDTDGVDIEMPYDGLHLRLPLL
eukprot:TRINITY_DN32394_c0_g1_i1.p1 TRINITY_DN32394_c0_g1~~TRINITY_DN32394_c0_g1_i1.p1  ORF type:complete len:340 (+),score=69.61 TRINITY_DN32394_c0_g1_i1:65-1084(+)